MKRTEIWTWRKGRQNAPYSIFTLFSFWRIDLHIIKCNGAIPPHTDKVPNKKHYRLNFTLKGRDEFHGKSIWRWWRFNLFRPDINEHSVGEGKWWMLSFGWVTDKPPVHEHEYKRVRIEKWYWRWDDGGQGMFFRLDDPLLLKVHADQRDMIDSWIEEGCNACRMNLEVYACECGERITRHVLTAPFSK